MPKLIRLLGDSAKSNTEISNTFKQPLIVKPHSRVALVGVSAMMADDLGNNLFQIIGNGDGQYLIGVDGEVATATVTPGVYDNNQFTQAMQQAANFSGAAIDDKLVGVDHRFSLTDNILTIDTAYGPYTAGNANFNYWTVIYGVPSVPGTGTNSLDNTKAGNGTASLILDDVITRVHAQSIWGLTVVAGLDIHVNARHLVSDEAVYGFKTTGSVYNRTINNISAEILDSTGATIAVANGDSVFIETYGGNLRFSITDAAGDGKGSGFGTTPPVAGQYFYQNVISRIVNNETLHWTLLMEEGTKIENCGYSCLSNYAKPYSTDAAIKDSPVSAVLQFVTSDDPTEAVSNPTLATYAGFGGIFSAIPYEGNPASLRAPEPMLGLANNGAILVTLDGIGRLQSFDGASQSKSAENIVYVLNSTATLGQYLQIDMQKILYLDLDNEREVNVNQLRVRMLSVAGYQGENRVLKFLGSPSFTFVIDDQPK